MWLLCHVNDCPNDYDVPGTDVVYVERIWMTLVDLHEVIQGCSYCKTSKYTKKIVHLLFDEEIE